MKYLVTGGCGFIGSQLIRTLIKDSVNTVFNIDNLSYAASPEAVASCKSSDRYHFLKADICDHATMTKIFSDFRPEGVIHLAAESHVDRSIDGPAAFLQTNIMGTYTLLDVSFKYFQNQLDAVAKSRFRFHHVSTDEVYGSLGATGLFTETTPYQPNSPYSASKASSDHLVRAWHHTYGLPVITTNCSNNYGPWQFPEKLIPLVTIRASRGESIPVYGNGGNIRDWIHVSDHVNGMLEVFKNGRIGETYNLGGNSERSNLDVVHSICDVLDQERPHIEKKSHRSLISFVKDRPGHDFRYAIDSSKAAQELGWKPKLNFENGIRQTVMWYLENETWWDQILKAKYSTDRLGLSK